MMMVLLLGFQVENIKGDVLCFVDDVAGEVLVGALSFALQFQIAPSSTKISEQMADISTLNFHLAVPINREQ